MTVPEAAQGRRGDIIITTTTTTATTASTRSRHGSLLWRRLQRQNRLFQTRTGVGKKGGEVSKRGRPGGRERKRRGERRGERSNAQLSSSDCDLR